MKNRFVFVSLLLVAISGFAQITLPSIDSPAADPFDARLRQPIVLLRSYSNGVAEIDVTLTPLTHIFIESEISIPVTITPAPGSKAKVKRVTSPETTDYNGDRIIRTYAEPRTVTFVVEVDEPRSGLVALDFRYQVCLDDVGVCLSPITETMVLRAGEAEAFVSDVPPAGAMDIASGGANQGLLESLASRVAGGNNIAIILLFCFLAGIASYLMPCVYPLLGITISYLGESGQKEKKGSFSGALLFGSGIVITYTILGVLVNVLSRVLSRNIQFGSLAFQPVILIPLLIFFFYFTFSMFGFYEFKMPGFLQQAKDKAYKQNSSPGEKILMGGLTGLVASPCVGPVVGIILQESFLNPQTGYLYMIAYSIGFSSVIVVLGTFSALLSKLPKSGGWMNYVQLGFGILMSAFTFYYASILFEVFGFGQAAPYLAVVVFLVAAFVIHLITKRNLDEYLKSERIKAFMAVMLFAAGAIVYGTIQNPSLEATAVPEPIVYAEDFDEALAIAAEQDRLIFIDFTAVWCANCEELVEKVLFRDPVKSTLGDGFVFVTVDVDHDPIDLQEEYDVKWLPWIVVVDAYGEKVYERNSFGVFNQTLAASINAELSRIQFDGGALTSIQ